MRSVFHFDINGTITAVDTTEIGTPIQNANMVISKSVYGTVTGDTWALNDDCFEEGEGRISFYDHLKSVDMKNYKRRSFQFTEKTQPGESLANLVDSVSKTPFLFESFVKCIETFPDALIVIRTFGQDVNDVIKSLRAITSVASHFKNISVGATVSATTLNIDGKNMSFEEFNDLMKISDRHIFIQENYDYWNSNSRKKEHGKQLVADPKLFQFFFDDNDCVNVINNHNNQAFAAFIRINTMQALNNSNYYVDMIKTLLNVINQRSCDACKKKSADVKSCDLCPPYSFCNACAVSERHDGHFMCNICNMSHCNTYREPNGSCYKCKMRGLFCDLRTAFASIN